jgi:hypothetical protein
VGGVLIGVVLQALAVLAVFGPGAFNAYAAAARGMPALAAVLEPDAYKMHSIRALTHLLPGRADLVVWAVLSVAVVAATARIWRQRKPWRLRFGVLVIASALVNPHLTIYDVTVIALPVIWIGGWLRAQHADTTAYWQVVYWIAVALLLPTAALLRVQLSTILIVGLFVLVVRTAGTVSYHECIEPSR